MDLTIGMATYDDFDGVYFTLSSLHAHHPRAKYLVIDNAPKPCTRTRAITQAVGGRYLHRPDLVGTAAPRDAIFRLAETPWAMCLDSHVLLELGAVQSLRDFIARHAESNDLLTGPLVYDDGKSISTHWRADAPPGLWGVWDTDPRHKTEEAFEIPMQGLGLFAMRCAAWPGFHPLFRGFGAEEGYVHEKVRQRGGRNLCLSKLLWRHRFRHMEHGSPPPPYPLSIADHTWNLLVGHRELGIDAGEQIKTHFGRNLSADHYARLIAEAEAVQPFGVPADRQRKKLLGIWYTNNAAPEKLLQDSLRCLERAVGETMHHDVAIAASAWQAIPGNPFVCMIGKPDADGHLAILQQIERCLEASKHVYPAGDVDGVCFLEHDVLYPPNYFDKVGDALASGAPVVSNLDYQGLNGTGWLDVKERHEPMHQLSMRRDVALANIQRAKDDAAAGRTVYLEPPGDRGDWVRLPVRGLTPAIHVNHPKRFTNHGEVVFQSSSKGKTTHPFWGDFKQHWPLEPTPETQACNTCGGPPVPAFTSVNTWFEAAKNNPSDFHEHVQTLRDLAAGVGTAVELSHWLKPALIAMAAGKPTKLVSICPAAKPDWTTFAAIADKGFELQTIQADPLQVEPVACDLLFIDTAHQAERLYQELARWAPHCTHKIVIHCTETYGETGDDGKAGVLPAIRRYVRENPQWGVVEHHAYNHGLTVLSCAPADRPKLPSTARQVLNFAKAVAKHVAGGSVLPEDQVEARLDVCALCPQRVEERCSKCGCPLVEGKGGMTGKAFLATEECPLGKWPLLPIVEIQEPK